MKLKVNYDCLKDIVRRFNFPNDTRLEMVLTFKLWPVAALLNLFQSTKKVVALYTHLIAISQYLERAAEFEAKMIFDKLQLGIQDMTIE